MNEVFRTSHSLGDPTDDLSGPKQLSKLDANTVDKDTVSRRDFSSDSYLAHSDPKRGDVSAREIVGKASCAGRSLRSLAFLWD